MHVCLEGGGSLTHVQRPRIQGEGEGGALFPLGHHCVQGRLVHGVERQPADGRLAALGEALVMVSKGTKERTGKKVKWWWEICAGEP